MYIVFTGKTDIRDIKYASAYGENIWLAAFLPISLLFIYFKLCDSHF